MASGGRIEYAWKVRASWQHIAAEFHGAAEVPAADSEGSFIAEHYWGYGKARDGSTLEYEVSHPPWRIWSASNPEFTGDVAGPIFTGGGIKAANRQAEARRDQSLALYEKAIQNAFRDVDDSLAEVRNSRDLQVILERRVQSLQEGVRLATLRYDNGYTDYINVLDTERGLYNAQLSLTQARGGRYRAVISLYRALGGDWVQASASVRQ